MTSASRSQHRDSHLGQRQQCHSPGGLAAGCKTRHPAFDKARYQSTSVFKPGGEGIGQLFDRPVDQHQAVAAFRLAGGGIGCADRGDLGHQSFQQRGQIAAAAGDQQDAILGPEPGFDEHASVKQRGSQGVAIAQRNGAVDIGMGAGSCGHVIFARYAGEGFEYGRIVDAAGAQLAVNHRAAGGGKIGARTLGSDSHDSTLPRGLYCTNNTVPQSPCF